MGGDYGGGGKGISMTIHLVGLGSDGVRKRAVGVRRGGAVNVETERGVLISFNKSSCGGYLRALRVGAVHCHCGLWEMWCRTGAGIIF